MHNDHKNLQGTRREKRTFQYDVLTLMAHEFTTMLILAGAGGEESLPIKVRQALLACALNGLLSRRSGADSASRRIAGLLCADDGGDGATTARLFCRTLRRTTRSSS